MKAWLMEWQNNLRTPRKETVQQPAAVDPDIPLTPMLDRLKKLVESLPPAQRQQGLPLEFYRERIQGRQAGRKAHAGELGAALRKLGYTRRRAWDSKDGVFRALWHPSVESL